MATEAVVSFVVERLGNLLIEEGQLLLGVRDQVESIKRELKCMQCLLKDADAKQKGDERVRNWVAEIRDLSYDADDIIDTFTLSQAAKIARWRRGVLIGCLSLQQISELKTRYKVGKEIRQIKLKIAEISNSLVTYGIKDINDQAGGQDARLGERRRLNAMFEEQDVVGFQEEMRILKERLINGELRRCVISLVGMGGAGFIHQRGDEVLEDVAEDYLNELISRSMIQVASRRCTGSVSTCRIHDLLRGLSISEAVQNNFFTIGSDIETNSPSTKVRRRALYHNTEMHRTINRSTATLRSILCFSEYRTNLYRLLEIGGELIRVLDVEGFDREVRFGGKIGESVHLRYLSLRDYVLARVLLTSCNLSYLQTLDLDGEGTLSNAIWNLERLRHLRAYGYDIDDGHPRLHNLRNIQTLCLKGGSWINDGLHKMTNLRKLGISQISLHMVLSDSIEKLCSLRSFTISSDDSILSLKSFARHFHLYKMRLDGQLEKLPDSPPYLAKLTLYNSQLRQDAIAILEKLPNLRILRLLEGSYCSKQMICSSKGFPQLDFLKLQGLDLEEWIVEEGAMPSLKNVKLFLCEDLKTFPERIHHLLGS